MILIFAILLTILLGTAVIFIYGKENIKRIIIPLLISLIGIFLLLYAKFVAGDNLLTLILYLPATLLLIPSLIWLTIILYKSMARKNSKKEIVAIVLCLVLTTVIIFIPTLDQIDKFKRYQADYFAVSDAIFQAYDEGEVLVGDQFASPPYRTDDLDELKTILPDKIINKMKKLNQSAGVHTYILADEDVIYFGFGAFFQAIDGIAIYRNGKDPASDETLKSRFFDGNTSYRYITDGAYYFSDGL